MTGEIKCYDVIIIGAGAAGLMCAIEAGKRGRTVMVIEHNDKIGKKILISGGGRCNFTNIYANPDNFISQNPHFCKSALTKYTPENLITLVKKHNIKYFEKKLGQLFCVNSSKEIVEMLVKESNDAGVRILINCKVSDVMKPDKFNIKTNDGDFECKSLVLATGGVSIPKMGATDFGYRIAKKFGIKIIEPYPGLVPLVFNKSDLKSFGNLSGVSINAEVSCNKISFHENILFTHKGLSGPAILQISSYWKKGNSIFINLLPDKNTGELLKQNKGSRSLLDNFLSLYLPGRFAKIWCEKYFRSVPVNKLTGKDIENISRIIHKWDIKPAGTEGFEKAEVTAGGIDTNEISSKTMESKKVRNLFFIGECVDVTGWLGGYNFQWAWASGYAAGNSL
jgi:predicted Rossmann fold flavoprotein